jgi:hypothetical protein
LHVADAQTDHPQQTENRRTDKYGAHVKNPP